MKAGCEVAVVKLESISELRKEKKKRGIFKISAVMFRLNLTKLNSLHYILINYVKVEHSDYNRAAIVACVSNITGTVQPWL